VNIYRPQKPYVFRPPKYSRFWAPGLRCIARLALRRYVNVRSIRVEGIEPVRELASAKQMMLIAPSHSDHADPSVLVVTSAKHGMSFRYMAAREGFERHPAFAFVLQHLGAFSVDREGADIAAIKTAIQILQDAQAPLVIFPEGEIYHHHEQLGLVNEGVATIFLRALGKADESRTGYLVPAAMRYLYDPSVSATFSSRLDRMEDRIGWKPRPELPVVDRIYRLGAGLLSLKEQEFLGMTTGGDLTDRITNLRDRLIERVENRHGLSPRDKAIPERVRLIRAKIRKLLLDADHPPSGDALRMLQDDLDTIFVVLQLYSYPGTYVRTNPTHHRIAETLLKMEEDVLGKGTYPSPRDAILRFGAPLDVRAFLRERGLDAKSGVEPLTRWMADAIQQELAATDPGERCGPA
jgi:1-acyl-sn-glycerol-3-phosphate acyltransferase